MGCQPDNSGTTSAPNRSSWPWRGRVVSGPLRFVDEVRMLHLGHEMGEPLGHIGGTAQHEPVVQPVAMAESVIELEPHERYVP